ncbi:MAG: HEAT repeat domain-containing protein, partial [Planctomycetota bacterium]
MDGDQVDSIRAVSNAVEIEITPVEKSEFPWGSRAEGVQVRLRPRKLVWNEGEDPAFEVDIRNVGTREMQTCLIHSLALEVDGEVCPPRAWRALGTIGVSLFAPGDQHTISARLSYFDMPEKGAGELSPGKHTLKAVYLDNHSDRGLYTSLDKYDTMALASSNTVEIEILASRSDVGSQTDVRAMIEEIKKRSDRGWQAVGVLSKMGPEAEEAIECLIEAGLDKDLRFGDGQQSTAAYRGSVLYSLSRMTWARDRVLPVLQKVAQDSEEEADVRRQVILALRNIGKNAMPILRKLTEAEDRSVRDAAHGAIGHLLEKEEGLSKDDYYSPLIEKDPFGPSVLQYLANAKGIVNYGRPHPLTQKIKKLYREQLAKQPDPQLAWRLARIVQNGLKNTELMWAAPVDWSRVRWPREDPTENYATLAEVLQLGFEHAEPGSQLQRQFGTSLAKLRLLQGDWDGMNAMLRELGQEPIPKESRQWLPAPPVDWEEGLGPQWKKADESMRSGNCGLEFRIEKDGKGLKGAHFLVKRAPEPTNVITTGVSIDTLFFRPSPLTGFSSFGYKAADRPMTRYAVSDESGIVRFEKLPRIPIKIEVLVPTSNFQEAASNWDLCMEVEPDKFKIAKKYGAGAINTQIPPAVAELKEGQTVKYPKLVVRTEGRRAWGEEVGGLRAAVDFVPDKTSYVLGERADVRLHIKNVSDKNVEFESISARQDYAIVRDSEGREVKVDKKFRRGTVGPRRHIIKPGEVLVLDTTGIGFGDIDDKALVNQPKEPYYVGSIVHCNVGEYFIRYRVNRNLMTGERKVTITPRPKVDPRKFELVLEKQSMLEALNEVMRKYRARICFEHTGSDSGAARHVLSGTFFGSTVPELLDKLTQGSPYKWEKFFRTYVVYPKQGSVLRFSVKTDISDSPLDWVARKILEQDPVGKKIEVDAVFNGNMRARLSISKHYAMYALARATDSAGHNDVVWSLTEANGRRVLSFHKLG